MPNQADGVFISCVSDDFENVGATFPGLRGQLHGYLARTGCNVRVQEVFRQTPADTVKRLADEVSSCAVVIHLLGERSGATAHPAAVAEYLQTEPNFLARLPELRAALGDYAGISYTQWEAFIALHHGIPLLVYATDQALAQQTHLDRLKLGRRHATQIKNDTDLLGQLIGDLHDILPAVPRFNRTPVGAQLQNGELHRERLEAPFDAIRQLRLEVYGEQGVAKFEKRQSVIGATASWRSLREGCYMPRPALLAHLGDAFDKWWLDVTQTRDGQYPVFWLDGRSGDGKSVALLQLAERHMLLRPNVIVAKLDDPGRLPEAVRWLQRYSNRALILIDDLHRVGAQEELATRLRGVVEEGCAPIRILACGPTPERTSFEHGHRRLFSVTCTPIPCATVDERAQICAWLGKPVPSTAGDDTLLVELLFELQVGEPIQLFARALKARLEQVGLLDAMHSVLAVNALDIAAPHGLIGNEIGRDFVERLAEPDQRHFDLRASMPNGKAGLRFSHTRIAWQVFWEWTHNALTRRDERQMAKALLPALLAVKADLPTHAAIVNAFFDRWKALQSGDKASPTRLAEAMLDGVLVEPEFAARFLHALFQGYNRTHTVCGSARLFNTVRQILRGALRTSWDVPGLAGAWLWRVSTEAEYLQPGDHELCWQLLSQPEVAHAAAQTLVFLAGRPPTQAAWRPRLETWLTNCGDCADAWPAWVWWLSREPRSGVALQGAMKWCEANAQTSRVFEVLKLMVKAAPLDGEVWIQALAWCEINPQTPGVHQLLAQLLSAAPLDGDVRSKALALCEMNPQKAGVQYLLGQLVIAAPLDGDIRSKALVWCETNPQTPGVHELLARLLSVAPEDVEVRQKALGWCELNAQTPGVHQLLTQLLRRAPADGDIWRRALAWCESNSQTPGVHELIKQLLSAAPLDGAVRKMALVWCGANAQTRGVHELIKQLLSAAPLDGAVLRMALDWCEGSTKSPGAHQVLTQLLSAAPQNVEVRAKALEWCTANAQMPGAFNLLAKLLNSAAPDVEVRHRAFALCEANSQAPGALHLLARLRDASPNDAAFGAAAGRQVDARTDDPETGNILWCVFKTDGTTSADEITRIEKSLEALKESAAKQDAFYMFLLKLAAVQEPLERIYRHFPAIGDDKHRVPYRAELLGRLLRDAPKNERAFDLLVAFKHDGEKRRDVSTLRLVAGDAAVMAVEAVHAAALRRPSDARDLLFLIALSAGFTPGLGQRLLALEASWPHEHVGFFWRALLACEDVEPATYLPRLLAVLNTMGYRSREIVRALAKRSDYRQNFARHMPSRIAYLVAQERRATPGTAST